MRRFAVPFLAILAATALGACSTQTTYGSADPKPASVYAPNMNDR